jgi:stage IV sporulation protein FB
MRRGYLRLFTVRGVPVSVHWSLPIGALVLGGLRLVPGFWLGFVIVVLVHESGHALIARALGVRVHEIEINGMGGLCRHDVASEYASAQIAWGGVLAQAALLALAVPLSIAMPVPFHVPAAADVWAQLMDALVRVNLLMIVINLLPIPPLDGARAWQLLRLRRSRPQRRSPRAPASASEQERAIRRQVQEALERARQSQRPPH